MSPINFSISPEISIILGTYNRATYLQNCINSVIDQVFQDWELIIVDDGSADKTFEIVNPYIQKYNNIRYLKHKNCKHILTKNAGIQASFGRYITFIDSDDRYKPQHLQSRIDYMKAHPEIDLIEGGFETHGDIWAADCYNPGQKISVYDCVLEPTFFGKRQVFFELKGFRKDDLTNPAYSEGAEFWTRAEKLFKTQKLIEPKTYIYTRDENSFTINERLRKLDLV